MRGFRRRTAAPPPAAPLPIKHPETGRSHTADIECDQCDNPLTAWADWLDAVRRAHSIASRTGVRQAVRSVVEEESFADVFNPRTKIHYRRVEWHILPGGRAR